VNEPDFELGARLRARELRVREQRKATTRIEGDLQLVREVSSLPETDRADEAYRDAEVKRRLEARLRKPN
jgi:hypothetical protein